MAELENGLASSHEGEIPKARLDVNQEVGLP